jgi:arsenate reductase-like glutaredoxin family protein
MHLVECVLAGLITHEEAMAKNDLSREELESWISRYTAGGAEALKAKNTQKYRGHRDRDHPSP